MKYILRFRAGNKDIWLAIKNGKKKVETRAGTPKYQKVVVGDELEFVCDGKKFIKKLKRLNISLLSALCSKNIAPAKSTQTQKLRMSLLKCTQNFFGYTEKIKLHGLIAWNL